MAADPLLFLTGHVSTIFPPVQAIKKIWHQELILSIAARNQPAEGLVKIQFAEQHMRLLDGLRLGEYVTVGFTVRGVDYYLEVLGRTPGSATSHHPGAWLAQKIQRAACGPERCNY